MTHEYYLVVETDEGLVPVACFAFKKPLRDEEREKIAKRLSGSGKLRWGLTFGLRRTRLAKRVKSTTMMTAEELKEKGVNPEEYPVISVPVVLG